MKLGVFDSGIGGKAIAKSLQAEFPEAKIITVDDRKHVPYGSRQKNEVIRLTETAIQPLLDAQVDVIVIACNTATAAAIDTLRARYPSQRFIGIEPMLKPASRATSTKTIAVCATPATLNSQRYQAAKQLWLTGVKVFEPDVSDWAELIENSQLNRQKIESTIHPLIEQGADMIVLGCTHYHWIKEEVLQITGQKATVLEPSKAISARVRELLD